MFSYEDMFLDEGEDEDMDSGQLSMLNEESKSNNALKRYAEKTFGTIQNKEMRTGTREVLAKQKAD